MNPRVISFARADSDGGDLPVSGALVQRFISCIKPGTVGAEARYSASARHFVFWAEQEVISLSDVDDASVLRFEQHRCRCAGLTRHRPNRPVFISKVRRFVRFLGEQGIISRAEDIPALDAHLADYATFLQAQQYSAVTRQGYQSEAEHFAIWARLSCLKWADLTQEHADLYAGHDCRCPIFRKRGTLAGSAGPNRRRRGADRFVKFLRTRSALPPLPQTDPKHDNFSAYRTWLKANCGSSEETIRRYSGELRQMLPAGCDDGALDTAGIRRIVSERLQKVPSSATLVVGVMRSYVNFLISRGLCQPALLHAFPRARRYRMSTLPRYLDNATIEKIVGSCGADIPVQIRDKAIILLLARLGLRANDICRIRLTDIDWNSGYLSVRGKAKRNDRLPLPQDVGDAILDYLQRARPYVEEERLFVRAQPPFTPFKSSGEITGIVGRVLNRGGLSGLPTRSHTFRHSLATRMLRAGAGLESVGAVLRHQSPATTAIYAKVDIPMLLKVAQDWPGDEVC